METRANYLLIGAFTLAAILGLLGFFVWLAQVQIDRQYDRYDVLFDNVSGLSQAGDVRFNGLTVGQVLSLDLDPSGAVRVRIEVDAETPVRADSTAQLQSQGVTGVSFVALTSGTPGAPLLSETTEGVPEIRGQRSVVDALVEDAPDVLQQALDLLRRVQEFAGPENQESVRSILANVAAASGQLERAMADFSQVSEAFSTGTEQITAFTGRLDEIGATVQGTLESLDETLRVAAQTVVEAEGTFRAATGALGSAQTAFEGAEGVIRTDVPRALTELTDTARQAGAAIDAAQRDFGAVMAEFGTAADLGSARLAELQGTLSTLDRTLVEAESTLTAVESASVIFEDLVDGEGSALVADARRLFAQADTAVTALSRAASEDVPAIVTEVRGAVTTANRVIDQFGTEFGAFSARLGPLAQSAGDALRQATQTLTRANGTMDRLDGALAAAESTLVAAEDTFTGATGVIETEAGPAMADIRASATQFRETMAALTDDLPAIIADLRDTVGRIDAVVASSAPPIRDFAETGLPQFSRFAQEAQTLVESLDRLARRIERDPTRFLLGSNPPEFRR